ncbi:LytR/AlgR family response regulator transcription factor [Massilia norwichensis]|jgi:two-component system, LytTR family, response regulator|uniref:LytTR family DNA-binding domain-containing protein n=1 Tax=Massilia norwichensis TaxID=1442366 RepID=A0ABT2AEH6_9BURK|nr:LytTR family DNA-binding domain-containing protein [Massilia norwichensis]MCS0592621.1 LytTR family DNA-binding domain-containing protein [Massilia norwichensis]
MSVRYLIVDDEAPSRANLRLALAAHPDWLLLAECDGAAAARAALADNEVDVIFLDIQMPIESGLVLAREISRLRTPPLIVFVTAYSEHAVDAFEVHALDYLLKPLSDARLAQAVERIGAMLGQRQREAYGAALRDYVDAGITQAAQRLERINVRSVGRIEQIRVDDILWVESAGNYVELQLDGRTVLHRITLNRLEALLEPSDFLRVHRSAIVRRSQIARLETIGDGSYRLTLRCGAEVAVSERYLGALKAAM